MKLKNIKVFSKQLSDKELVILTGGTAFKYYKDSFIRWIKSFFPKKKKEKLEPSISYKTINNFMEENNIEQAMMGVKWNADGKFRYYIDGKEITNIPAEEHTLCIEIDETTHVWRYKK